MKKYYKYTSSQFIHVGPTITQFTRPKSTFPIADEPELRFTLTALNLVLALIFQRCHSAAVYVTEICNSELPLPPLSIG